MNRLILCLLIAGICISCRPEPTYEFILPSIISDHMVLQQQQTVPLWGWTAPNTAVRLSADWRDQSLSTTTDHNGRWQIDLPTPAAGGPYSLTIEADTTIKIRDVMVGEVWLCSGQSNMEMTLSGYPNEPIEGGEAAIANADAAGIRYFNVPRNAVAFPQRNSDAEWVLSSPKTAKRFSAIAYFYARKLHDDMNVPVGIIDATWGGTPVRAWTSIEKLAEFEEFAEDIRNLSKFTAAGRTELGRYEQNLEAWLREVGYQNENNPGSKGKWMAETVTPEGWQDTQQPALWQSMFGDYYTGVVWVRRSIELPADLDDAGWVLELGPIDEMDDTWVNGQHIGRHDRVPDWTRPRRYPIPGGLLKSGRNTIAVRTLNTFGGGGLYGEPEQLRLLAADGSSIPLAGTWQYRIELDLADFPKMPTSPQSAVQNAPAFLYNGMINPVAGYGLRGFLWYQGESDVGRAGMYGRLFPAMIRDWRDKWKDRQLPFYFVQIAPYDYGPGAQSQRLREAQLKTLWLPYTGMAVTTDLGLPKNIHPPYKKQIADRLYRWALADVYDKPTVVSGPLYRAMSIEGSSIRLEFDHAESGLAATDGVLRGFEIAGADKEFQPARARIDGQTIVVSHPQISKPWGVRFGWSNLPDTNLINREGLPASPFRTYDDDFEAEIQRDEPL